MPVPWCTEGRFISRVRFEVWAPSSQPKAPLISSFFFNTQSARKGHVNRWWVAQPDFKMVEYGLWAASTILGLLALMHKHVKIYIYI